VLVVDDEPGMRMGVARALGDCHFDLTDIDQRVAFTVETADTGEKALEMIRASEPDILLLDHKLPGMSGLDVLDHVGRSDHMLTIMITAYASLETAVSAIKQGAYDFLAKPFTPSELKTTIRRAAETLITARQARRLAQEKRQVRFEFIRVVAHELKSPLAAVEGYLQIVRDRTAGDDQATYDHMLDRCLIRTRHMRKLIVDLLDLTHIESGRKKRELAEVDVRALADTAVETAMPDARARSITLQIHGSGPLLMMADAGEIEIVLNNLVSNAVKYNRDNGRVDVRLGGDADTITIAVTDTGIGMSKEETSRLFGEFVRIKNDRTRNILGSGLGLSIVRRLATLYGGEVRVESEPDVGSTFTVVLSRKVRADQAVEAVQDHDA